MKHDLTVVPSLEYLGLQADDPWLDKFVQAIQDLRNEGTFKADSVAGKPGKNIEDLLRDRFKMNIEFSVNPAEFSNAWVYLPELDKNHPFFQLLPHHRSNSVGKMLSNLGERGNRIGKIDLEKLTVSGVYSKIAIPVAITKGLINHRKITARSIAGVLLHEIGHAFNYFVHLTNSTFQNFATNMIAAEVMGAGSDKEREAILVKGSRLLGVDGIEYSRLNTQTQEQIATTLQAIYINDTRNTLRSETGHSLYEIRANEQLADFFSTRFGLAADLAEAMSVIEGDVGSLAKAPKGYLIAVRVTLGTLMVVSTILTGGVAGLVAIQLAASEQYHNVGIYDKPKERIQMLKRYMIQSLKDAQKDKGKEYLVGGILKDLERVEKVLSEYNDELTIGQWLADKIIPFARSVKNSKDFQKSIEAMLYNEVHITAAKFAQLKSGSN